MLSLLITALALGVDAEPQARLDPAELGVPFQRYTTSDALGRTITFYLSLPANSQGDAKLPVALIIPGSGCQSLFQKRGEQISGGQQTLLCRVCKGRVRVLAVEKPGVKFLDAPARPGSAEGSAEEFRAEHTLPRWAEANVAALRAVWTLPNIDTSRTLVVGHSEGGIVAARIAATLPNVTHVASLAGGGPTQLFSLAESRTQARANDKPGDSAARLQKFYEEWSAVQKTPDSPTAMWLGHPHRRWTSFLATSVTQELLRTKARVFVAQGGRDTSVPPTGHHVLVAELKSQGHSPTVAYLEDADHSFNKPDVAPASPDGLLAMFGQVLDWFLEQQPN